MFPLNTFENLCVFFLLLMIYSAAGWVGEMFYCSVGKGHICEKRGFLNGFICPIYGHGALLVLYVLHGGLKNPLLTFLAGMALTSALERRSGWERSRRRSKRSSPLRSLGQIQLLLLEEVVVSIL